VFTRKRAFLEKSLRNKRADPSGWLRRGRTRLQKLAQRRSATSGESTSHLGAARTCSVGGRRQDRGTAARRPRQYSATPHLAAPQLCRSAQL